MTPKSDTTTNLDPKVRALLESVLDELDTIGEEITTLQDRCRTIGVRVAMILGKHGPLLALVLGLGLTACDPCSAAADVHRDRCVAGAAESCAWLRDHVVAGACVRPRTPHRLSARNHMGAASA